MLPSPCSSTEPGRREPTRDPYRDDLLPTLIRLRQVPADDPERATMRAALVTGFHPLVERALRHFAHRGEPLDDLRQAGLIGLLHAVDRFAAPPDRDPLPVFLHYAQTTIIGEIRQHFRDRTSWLQVSRKLRDLQGPLRRATAELTRTLHRAPRPSELAEHLGVDAAVVAAALDLALSYTPLPLDQPSDSGAPAPIDVLGYTDTDLERVTHRSELRAAFAQLPRRHRQVVVLRFFGDLTQTQIAAEIGVSQMHVSRLLSQSLHMLRERMRDR